MSSSSICLPPSESNSTSDSTRAYAHWEPQRIVQSMTIRTKRASEPVTEEDGIRVLVDRYWPRDVLPHDVRVDLWVRDIAPSPRLVAWYGHRAERWEEFKQRYWEELEAAAANQALERLRSQSYHGGLTLLHGSRDRDRNPACALAEYLSALPVPDILPPAPFPLRRPAAAPLRIRHRAVSGLEWIWILFALLAPIVALVAAELLAVFGARAWAAFTALLAVWSVTTVVRVIRRERSQTEWIDNFPREERESVWRALGDLSVQGAGVALGLVILAGVLGAFAYFAGVWH